MIVLYVLGGLLLFLLLLTLTPLHAALRFQEEFGLELRYLFFRYKLQPGQEPKEEPEPEPEPEKEKPQKAGPDWQGQLKEILRQKGLGGFLQGLGDLLKLLGRTSGRLLRRLKLREFDLYLCLGGSGDAAAAALLYGRVSAGVYGACGGLFHLLPCKAKGLTVDLDYHSDVNMVDFTARLSIRPFFVLQAGLALLFGGLGIWRRLRVKPKASQSREKQTEKGSRA